MARNFGARREDDVTVGLLDDDWVRPACWMMVNGKCISPGRSQPPFLGPEGAGGQVRLSRYLPVLWKEVKCFEFI